LNKLTYTLSTNNKLSERGDQYDLRHEFGSAIQTKCIIMYFINSHENNGNIDIGKILLCGPNEI